MRWIHGHPFEGERLIWGIIFLLVTAMAALSYVSGTRICRHCSGRRPSHGRSVGHRRGPFCAQDAETAQRGFLLTGDAEFLSPYDAARAGLPPPLTQFAEQDSRAPGGVPIAPLAERS